MTALCGGGTSGPKIVPELALTYGAGRLAQLLVAAGISEFSAALPLVGAIPVLLSSFCASDPPAMTALTSAEATAVLNLDFGTDLANGLGKLKDILLNLVWLDTCRCTSGTLAPPAVPGAPADVPVFVPPSLAPGPITAQGWFPMKHADCKILALGCGSPARPAGWFLPTFDDSSWIIPVQPAVFAAAWSIGGGFQNGAGVGANPALTDLVQYNAPASPLAHNCEQFIIRWRVFLPDVTPALCTVRVGNASLLDGGWGTGFAYANGFQNVAPTNALSWQAFANHLIPNQWNVIGLDINPSNTGSANTWGTEGGAAIGLDFTSLQQPSNVLPCCPPDVTTQAYLDLILQAVTLIQRQSVPFGYVSGTAHAALSGAGAIAIGGLLGAKVDLTTIPGSYGREGTSPTEFFDLGFVTFGTADGFPSSYRLGKQSNLFLPARCGAYTVLDYDLAPGVVATITELVREP